MDLLIAAGCDVACDQCKFGDERTGCREACVQLAWIVCVRSGCPGACGQIEVDDELRHDASEVMVIAVCQILNSFLETQEALVTVKRGMIWCEMGCCLCFTGGCCCACEPAVVEAG